MMSSQYLLHVEQTFYFFIFFPDVHLECILSRMSLGSFLPPYLGNSSSSKKLMRESLFSVWHFLWFTFWGRMLELKFYFYPKDINLQSTKIVCSNSQASSHIVWALATMISMATPKCWSLDLVSCIQLSCFTSSKTLLVSNANPTKRFFWPMISILGNCLQCWTLLQIW